MYVEGPGPDRTRYIVDATGTAYSVTNDELLLRTLVGQGRDPQRVSADWLDTLHKGDPITFPAIEGNPGDPAGIPGSSRPTTTGWAWSSPRSPAPGHSSTWS